MAEQVKTWQQLAAAMDVHPSTLKEWRDRPDWPLPQRKPRGGFTPEQIADLATWRAETLQEDRASQPQDKDRAFWQREKDKEAALKLKREREIAEGKLVDSAFVEPAMLALTDLFCRELDDWVRGLPQVLGPMDPPQIEKELKSRVYDLRQRLAAQRQLELKGVYDKAEQQKQRGPGRPRKAS